MTRLLLTTVPTAAPLILPVDLARLLGSVVEVLPTPLLEAVRAVLNASARQIRFELQAAPGRRGNPDKRQRARDDEELADRLTVALRSRDGCPRHSRLGCHCEIDRMPALGENQWGVVACTASGWRGSLEQLYAIAAGIVPDEVPLDMEPWRAWLLRRSWTFTAEDTRADADYRTSVAARAERDAEDLSRRLEVERQRAATARGEARRLADASVVYRRALQLDDSGLASFERAIEEGLQPDEALDRAGGQRS